MRLIHGAACVLAFLLSFPVFSNPTTLTTIDFQGRENVVAAVPCTNGSIAVASTSLVARVTSAGVTDGPSTIPAGAVGIARCTESETIVVGLKNRRNAPRNTWLARISRDGTVSRIFELEGSFIALPRFVTPTADGAFIAGDVMEGPRDTAYFKGIFVVRIDAEAAIRWMLTLNTPAKETVTGLTPLDDGGVVVVGRHDQASFWAARIDSHGVVVWSRAFRLASSAVTASTPAGNGATILVGTGGAENVRPHISITRLSADGTVEWNRAFATVGWIVPDSVHPRRGGYLVAGHLEFGEKRDVVLLDLDENGEPAKQCIFSPPGGRVSWDAPVLQARGREGHFVVFGTADGFAYVTTPGDTLSMPSPCIECSDGLTEIDGVKAMPRAAAPVLETKAARWLAVDPDRPVKRYAKSSTCAAETESALKPVPRTAPAPPIELNPMTVADRLNCSELGRSAGALLAARRYDDLDAVALRIRGKNARNRDGSWKVPCLYVGLQRKSEALREFANADYDKLLTDWIDRGAKSATPWVALAWEMSDRGRRLSGDRDPATMTERGLVTLEDYLMKSRRLLDAVPQNLPRDVYLYQLEMDLAYTYFGNGGQMFHAAVRFEPEYEGFYEKAIVERPESLAGDFVRDAVKLTTERSADWIYALLSKHVRTGPFDGSGLSWARVRKGYETHLAKYPDDVQALKDFAQAACVAKERRLARSLFERPELAAEARLREQGMDDLENCRGWARETVAAAPVPATVAPAPSPPRGATTPWVDSPFETWPPIAMTTEVIRKGKSPVRRVSTFLVNVDGTTVAVSTSNLDQPGTGSVSPPAAQTVPPQNESTLHSLTRELEHWRVASPEAPQRMEALGAIWPGRSRLPTQGAMFSVREVGLLHAAVLERRRTPLPAGAETYIVARPSGAKSQLVVPGYVVGKSGKEFGECFVALKGEADPHALLGAAVIDDAGFVAAVVTKVVPGSRTGGGLVAEEIGLILGLNEEPRTDSAPAALASPAVPKTPVLSSGSWTRQPVSTWPAIALSTQVVREGKPAFTRVSTFLLDVDGTRVAVSTADLNVSRKPPKPGEMPKYDPNARPPRVALQSELREWRVAKPATATKTAFTEFWEPTAGRGGSDGVMLRLPDDASIDAMALKPRTAPITDLRTSAWVVCAPSGSATQKVFAAKLESRALSAGAQFGTWYPQILEPFETSDILGAAIIDDEGYAIAVVTSIVNGGGAGAVVAEEIGLLLGLNNAKQ